jgi:hypothetical protein
MVLRHRRFASVAFPVLALAGCGDEAPVYPPITIIGNGGASSTGGRSGNSPSDGGSGEDGGADSGKGGPGSVGGLYAHCAEFNSGPEPEVETECDLDALEDGGELSGIIDSDRTLRSGNFYTLQGGVKVAPGVTLTIEPCVKVVGADEDAVLVIQSSALGDPLRACTYDSGSITPPGRLVAVGEPMAPIIFTSSKPPGEREPGGWGGVLILGNARNDLAAAGVRVPIEGLVQAECHGYHTDEFDDEDSGELRYVRIEYASQRISQANETNGLTFGSVGSGTVVSHVMVSNSADDCFEWFGGTVNADHLIALNCDDDMFDSDLGHTGKLQFLFGRQFLTTDEDDSRGMEIDTGPGRKNLLTTTAISNYTVCGGGPEDENTTRGGLVFRTQAQPTLLNGFVTGFAGPGLLIDSARPAISYTTIFGQSVVAGPGTLQEFLNGEGNSAEEPDRFCDCWSDPPAPIPATPSDGTPPNGFGDDSAAYVGAFADSSPDSNWMRGLWVDWSSN